MSSGISQMVTIEPESTRWRTVSMTVGGDDHEDENDVQDLRQSLQAWNVLVGPSSSNDPAGDSHLNDPSFFDGGDSDFDIVLSSVFAEGNRLFTTASDTFVDEVFVEKKPKIIKGYLFGEIIGEGSYGKVKEVLEQKTLVRRAVKIFKESRLKKIPNGLASVEQELRILRYVKHRNVIRLHDSFRNDEKRKLYVVMEYCIGSLQQLLDGCHGKMMPEFQAQYFFKQLADGLSYLHAHGVIHKDIKPGNLLVTLDGTLKISDFGVAELLDAFQPDDWCTVVQGTPKFQPPEIVSGSSERYRGRKVDIWACGVTLYNIVSGEYPFEGDVIMRLFDNIATEPLKMPSSIQLTKSLKFLLVSMLEKDPEKRINMHDIRRCEWYMHHIEERKCARVSVNASNNAPAHRPLSIYVQLRQLYDNDINIQEVEGACSSFHRSKSSTARCSRMDVDSSTSENRLMPQALNEAKRNRSILSMCMGLSK